jgi:hypothetical protein
MKYIVAILLALAVHVALGSLVPVSNRTALIVLLLGPLGAFTYKGLATIAVFGALVRRA